MENSTDTTAMLGLLAETSLHAGAGQMLGVIDLPIQREAHTDWPVIYGSGVKGALRALADDRKAEWIKEVFGPDTGNASDNAGALLVGDARLLLLPVRSLTSHFKWVTCPALLKRLRADADRLGLPVFPLDAIPNADAFTEQQALIPSGKEGPLFLEEFRFHAKVKAESELQQIIETLAQLLGRDDAEEALKQQLTLIDDDLFRHLARFATPVAAHVCIDNDHKTVKPGALWYEETLPPDTVLYTCLMAQPSRARGSQKSAAEILDHVVGDLFSRSGRPYLQIGGNETVGMGWCKVRVWRQGVTE